MKILLALTIALPLILAVTIPVEANAQEPSIRQLDPAANKCVCPNAPNVKCPDGYVAISGGCFMFLVDVKASWLDARTECMDKNGYLATISTPDQMQGIVQYINQNKPATGEGYWIGATNAGAGNYWYNQDASPTQMGVPFWGVWKDKDEVKLEPGNCEIERCGALYKSYQYYTFAKPCDDKNMHPLCEAFPPEK